MFAHPPIHCEALVPTTRPPQVAEVELRQISSGSADLIAGGRLPAELPVAPDYPTEFSVEVARSVQDGEPLGPFFLFSTTDGTVVGEIGGTLVQPGTVEIGYAVVRSARCRGFAAAAVRQFIELAKGHPAIDRLVARTPLDRTASERVLTRSGFESIGVLDDEYGGVVIRVREWALVL
jgi:RimJ/RimL family protein N-acetyltransferase